MYHRLFWLSDNWLKITHIYWRITLRDAQIFIRFHWLNNFFLKVLHNFYLKYCYVKDPCLQRSFLDSNDCFLAMFCIIHKTTVKNRILVTEALMHFCLGLQFIQNLISWYECYIFDHYKNICTWNKNTLVKSHTNLLLHYKLNENMFLYNFMRTLVKLYEARASCLNPLRSIGAYMHQLTNPHWFR